MHLITEIFGQAWRLLLDSAVYVLFGLLIGGLLKVFLDPGLVARHLGRGRFSSVFKAALLGLPLPLCSCGVLPAAAALRKQGANTGATTAFLISTPESGLDSIAVSYALLDPIMTAARPLAGLSAALAAGLAENLVRSPNREPVQAPDLTCPVDACCDGRDCPPEIHGHHHSFGQKLAAGLKYALGELWADLAGWYLLGLLLAGLITALVPADLLTGYLGGGLGSMLLMLALGVPVYICATASTPIAASLILKGVSPGAALVFLLAGPATNVTSLTVLFGLLGRRATAIYLAAISVSAVLCGLALDGIYGALGLSAQATIGQARELIPAWAEWGGGLLLLGLSIGPIWAGLKRLPARWGRGPAPAHHCGCSDSCGH